MSATRPMTCDTFEYDGPACRPVKVEYADLGEGLFRVSLMEVDPKKDEWDLHQWTFDSENEEETKGIYETILSMKELEGEYLEALGFMYA